jgi:hypothetical protein
LLTGSLILLFFLGSGSSTPADERAPTRHQHV